MSQTAKTTAKTVLAGIALFLAAAGLLLHADVPQVPSNTWVPAGDMASIRAGATGTLLPNGLVLIAGGIDANGATSSVERFSPDGAHFLDAPAMQMPRANHTATLLADGRVLVAGGTGASGAADATAEIYDSAANAWLPAGSLNVARRGHTATRLPDGKVLIAGGDDNGVAIDSLEIFDPETALFTVVDGASTGVRTLHAAAALLDGRVLIAGGFDGTNPLASTSIYDPETNTVSAGPDLSTPRSGLTATTLLDGRVLIAGGAGGSGELASAEIFDPATNAFTPTDNTLSSARQNHLAFLLPHNNQVLIVGGLAGGNPVAAAEYFTPWEGTNGVFCAQAVCASGYPGPTAPSVARAWAAGSALSFSADATTRTGPNDGLLVLAGGTGQQSSALFGFATVRTDKEDYAPGTTVKITGSGWKPHESVALVLREAPFFDEHPLLDVEADDNGNITSTEFVPDEHDIGIRFYLTVYGQESQAQTTFTDNKNIQFTFAGTGSGSILVTDITKPSASTTIPSSCPNPTSCRATVDDTDVGTLTATADPGSTFTGWSAASSGLTASSPTCTGTNNPCNFSMANSGQSVTATFLKNDFVGSVTVGPQTGSVTYGTGGVVTYLITVNRGTSTGAFSVNISVGSLPANVSAGGVSNNPLVFGASDNSKTDTLTLVTTAAAFAQTNTAFSVTATDAALAADSESGNGALTINKRAITVTAATNSKTYDGTTSATATPTITSGTLVNGNAANFAEAYSDKNAGTGKTLVPSGTVTDGNSGNNYTYTFVNNTTGVINARPLTVTALTNTKTYDATTSAAAVPSTTGTIEPGDTANFIETYNNKNVGAGKTLTPSGTVTDGNSGNNYSYTFVPNGTGVILVRALTVMAQTNTKTYDGTTSAAATPLVTGGAVQSGDTANFIETYDNRSVGSAKTLTPSGTVTDGNSGNNYSYSFVNDTTGVINGRPITVTAQTNTKVYDSTTSAAAVPQITSGTLVSGDVVNFTEAYDTKHAGSGKTLTPAGTIADAGAVNVTSNYAITFVNNTTGVITTRPMTVTAQTNSKTYDGTTSAAATPQITVGTLAAGDVSTFTETYDTKHAGTGKALTPAGTIADAGAANVTSDYAMTFVNNTTGVIMTRPITVTALTNSKTYDGTTSAAATPLVTAGTLATGDVSTFTEMYDTKHVGTGKTLTPTGTIADAGALNVTADYAITFANDTTGVITTRPITVTAQTNTKTYDGTTSAAAIPQVTSGSLVSGDVGSFTETYDTKHAGSGKTLTPAGTIADAGAVNVTANYAMTFANDTTGVITARPITVTAQTNSKTYDGTTSAAATPQVTSGSVVSGDVGSFTETYDTKHVGTGKTLTPAGTIADAGAANVTSDYAMTFVNNTTGVITARPITVTAVTNSKTYDGTTSAAATPLVTAGTLATGDVSTFTETYDTKHVGTGKTLTPTGTIADAGALNVTADYAITFANDTTGVITTRPITVTAQAATKVYDGGVLSSVSPLITSGTVASGETGQFRERYDTRDVGTGKTMLPSGKVLDGSLVDVTGNYAISFANNTTGVITARPITVTAQTNTKTYDGTTSAAAIPQVTSGSLVSADVGSFTETYQTKHAGTGKTLTPAGTIADSSAVNVTSNYAIAFVNDTTGVINALPLTVTATTNTKVYDGNTSATATPAISVGAVQPGDTANFTEVYSNKNVGTGKTLIPSGTVTDGNGGNNYAYTLVNDTTGVIIARPITVTAQTFTKVYDGGVLSSVTPLLTSGTLASGENGQFRERYDTRDVSTGKTMLPTGKVLDGSLVDVTLNYAITFVNDTTGVITTRPITVTAQPSTKEYDGGVLSSVTPLVTSGSIAVGETGQFRERYATRDVGTGKTMLPSGKVLDGGLVDVTGNYTITFVNDTTGVITARAITVTAQTNTKTYDGTTSAAATPQMTSGNLVLGDVGSFTEMYDTKHAGTGKTLTPVGTITDAGAVNVTGNYAITFVNDTTGVINTRALTVTATTNTKVYDGDTSATATPAITVGAVQPGDTANFAEVYGNKNVGTGKTLIPSGAVTDGNGGNNYTYTFVNDTTGAITARLITVTAQTSTKGYDGGVLSSVTPLVTSGSIAVGETGQFRERYDTRDVSTGKTMLPSGKVLDGGLVDVTGNYTVTFVNDTTGVIIARAITVTAQTNTKVYDGNTSAAATPLVTSGSLVSGDVVSFTETYDTTQVATGKTLTPAGTIADSSAVNVTGNYTITFVNDTTGVITGRPLTVTAQTSTKGYDGGVLSSVAPLITSGSIAAGETGQFRERYDTREVGTTKTLIPTGKVLVGLVDVTANYTINFVNDTTGVITGRPITVTAQTNSKIYDGTTSATSTPQITAGTFAPGDVPTFTETYDTRDVGTSKTLTPAGTIADAGSVNVTGNYAITFVNDTTGVITGRPLTVTAQTSTKGYDGGVLSNVAPLITSGTLVAGETGQFRERYDTKDVGTGKTLLPTGKVLDGSLIDVTGNYTISFVNNTTGVITARTLDITANNQSKTYGTTLTFTGTEFSLGAGQLVSGDSVTSVTFTSAGATAAASVSGGPYAITPSSAVGLGLVNYAISYHDGSLTVNKATSIIAVTPYNITYDAVSHTAAGTATGVLSESLSGLVLTGTTHSNAGDYPSDPWTFTDVTGNYNNANGTVHDHIDKANPTINVAPYSVPYDTFAHTANGTAKGVLNESLAGLNLSGTTHTVVGDYATDPWTFTDATGNYTNINGVVHDSIGAWTEQGYFQPVDMTTGSTIVWNTVKGGSTVPLKFRIFAGGAEKTNVSAVSGFSLVPVVCGTGVDAPIDPSDLSTTGGTTLRYDGTAGQFIQNWQVPKPANQCYRAVMTAADGSQIANAFFKTK
jgi:hypothetical protein